MEAHCRGMWQPYNLLATVSGENFGHHQPKILAFPSPTGYMLMTSFGYLCYIGVCFINPVKMIGNFLKLLNFDQLR